MLIIISYRVICLLQVESETDAHSVEFERFVVSQPACIIRRLALVLQLGWYIVECL